MPINTGALGYLNGMAVAAYGATPADQQTIAILEQVVIELAALPAAYVATGSSATPVLLIPVSGLGGVASGGGPVMQNTFDTTTAIIKGTPSIPPKSLGV